MVLQLSFLGSPITLHFLRVGDDLSVLCTGGGRPHVGGCAMAVPYTRGDKSAAAVSSLSAPGHQDAVLAAELAGRLCRRLGQTVFVQCGIHYDKLSKPELRALQAAVLELSDQVEANI